MKKYRYPALLLLVMVSLGSCKKLEHISPIPHIEFTSFEIFDSTDILLGNQLKAGKLRFFFEDGDGDVGLKSGSGLTDTTNLFFTLYRKVDGTMVLAEPGDILYPSPYRIPYMERLGQNKILRGTISVTFLYLFYSPTDTIMYDFYIKDRALHSSNVASTKEIIISQNKIYR